MLKMYQSIMNNQNNLKWRRKIFEPTSSDVKRYNLKANYDLFLKIYQDTGNSNYFNKAQAIKHKIEQFRRMDVFIERAHRLKGIV